MNKLKAIDKLVGGLKVRREVWDPKTKHVFMEEDGNTYVAKYINDPDAQMIDLNYECSNGWEVME